jgi:hypothetical protein
MDPTERLPERLAWMVILVASVAAAVTVDDFGITWDEKVHRELGRLSWNYCASGGRDRAFLDYRDLRFYGVIVDLTAEAFTRWSGADERSAYTLRHACCLAAGVIALVVVYAIGCQLGGAWVGLWSVLALALMPRFVGHAGNNSKDVPFLAAYAIAQWSILRLLAAEQARAWRSVMLAGVCVGIALAVRIAALLLLGHAALALWIAAWIGRRPTVSVAAGVLAIVARWLLLTSCAWATMVVLWPFAQVAPLYHPLVALRDMVELKIDLPVLHAGVTVMSSELPRTYPLEQLAITLPVAQLALAGVGFCVVLASMVYRCEPHDRARRALTLLWLLQPLLLYAWLRNHVYDGYRHFLFTLPALALLAGIAVEWLAATCGVRRQTMVRGAAAALLLTSLPAIIRLHPLQATYYNGLVGGLPGAEGRYELDYYASSYRQAAYWLNEHAARTGHNAAHPLRVLAAVNDYTDVCLLVYLTPAVAAFPLLGSVDGPSPPIPPTDLYVALRRFDYDSTARELFASGPPIASVARDGVDLVRIYRRR